MNWLKIGYVVAPHLVTLILSVVVGILAFRRWIAPEILEALAKSDKVSKTLAGLGGMKKQDWHDQEALETVITKELLLDKMPELELLRMALSPSSWEQVEEMIQENPKVALQLYEKYKPLLGGASQKKEEYNF